MALEARPMGWAVRVLPHAGPVPAIDFAEIASPPYRSVSPLLLTTDFGFRAQDTVGWNPRSFHFVPNRGMYARVVPAYEEVTRSGHPDPSSERDLIQRLSGASVGRIQVLDATLVLGTADRSRAAAAVVSRFNETAHTVIASTGGVTSEQMGQITALAVRISLDLPVYEPPERRSKWVTRTAIPCSNHMR